MTLLGTTSCRIGSSRPDFGRASSRFGDTASSKASYPRPANERREASKVTSSEVKLTKYLHNWDTGQPVTRVEVHANTSPDISQVLSPT